MKRRQFIRLIGASTVAWPLTARGQVTRKRPLIARLSSASRDTPIVAKFIERFLSGMRELGYVEGRDFDMTYGWAFKLELACKPSSFHDSPPVP
jgi:putative ABC transport system substrate-binding protein